VVVRRRMQSHCYCLSGAWGTGLIGVVGEDGLLKAGWVVFEILRELLFLRLLRLCEELIVHICGDSAQLIYLNS